ncbi:MAG: riboflavin biosynthesis protein RibF [Acidobacteriota bacterium]|jgi:riboflavin kinase/FMN adenylyltransferase|nr:riboflavin biosynthesis protein RibF [Acidobacteriota bacterium]
MKVVTRLEDLAPEHPLPVVTVGNFDGVHLGHRRLIQHVAARAAEIGGTPMVLTFHPHPLQLLVPNHAPMQIQPLDQKLAVIASLGIPVTAVIPYDAKLAETDARDFAVDVFCERLRAREIYVGPNFAFGRRRQGSVSLLKEIGRERGFLAEKIPQVEFRGTRISSTIVRQALLYGQAALARRLLARPFTLEGTVIHGRGLGAKLQIPTANLRTDNELIPRRGVYVTRLRVMGDPEHAAGTKGDGSCAAVTNIGFRPTVDADAGAALSIETHALGFDRDIYGRRVSVEFWHRLRDERRFAGQDELVARIRKDKENARRYFQWLGKVTAQAAV